MDFSALAEQGPLVTFAIVVILALLRGDLVTKREYDRAADLADSYLKMLEGQSHLTDKALDTAASRRTERADGDR